MPKKPYFSVIIPSFNRAGFLPIAIESVLKQSFSDFELIVIDDGSTDKTSLIIKEFHDKRLRYIHQEHGGVSSARNHGIKKSKSKYICFLDSDDRFRHDKLTVTADYILRFPEYKIFHTEEVWYRNGRFLPQKKIHKKPINNVFGNALKLCCIGTSTTAVHASIFEDIGNFNEELPACEDYDFWLRVSAKYSFKLIPEFLTIKQGGHSDQQSKKYPAMDTFRIKSISDLIKSNHLNQEQFRDAYNELRAKCAIYIKGATKRSKKSEVIRYEKILDLHKKYGPKT